MLSRSNLATRLGDASRTYLYYSFIGISLKPTNPIKRSIYCILYRPEVLEQFAVLSGQLMSLNESLRPMLHHFVIHPQLIDPTLPNQSKLPHINMYIMNLESIL